MTTTSKKLAKLESALAELRIGVDYNSKDFWEDVFTDTVVPTLPPTTFIRDGVLAISGEEGDGLIDYYGEFCGERMYVHPKIEQTIREHGFYYEWDNPGSISVYPND